LFRPNRPAYLDLAVDKTDIKSTVYGHPEFAAFMGRMNTLFNEWRQKTATTLRQLDIGFHPKEVITALIAADGWKAETYRIIEKDRKGKEKDKGWTCDLVPKGLIVARYFAADQVAIDRLAVELENVVARITELEEEHGGEEGALSELDKVNKPNVVARLKEIKADKEANGEADILHEWLRLAADEADLKKALRDAEAALDANAYAKYPKLSETEIKTLVIDDKWLTTLDEAIHGEMDRISQGLTQRVRELAERYETPMPQMVNRVANLEAKVNCHLERMGFSWR
jgi:type I restriction enzyme M protein